MNAINRRNFLRQLGVSAATVPFVVGLDSLYARAAVPGFRLSIATSRIMVRILTANVSRVLMLGFHPLARGAIVAAF